MTKKRKERSLFHKSVNGFIIFIVVILALFTIFFGFSQTKTFRDYLRDTIVENVNESVNGKLSISNIEGSIFTSIKINDIVLTSEYDTVLTAGKVELNISPIQILLKKIYFRSIEIDKLKFHLREVEKNIWNLNSLAKADTSAISDSTALVEKKSEEVDDSGFPFIIQANNIELRDLEFLVKSNEYLNSEESYKFANYNDLKLTGLNMQAKALANPSENEYQLILNKLSLDINVDEFKLSEFSGAFQISNESVSARKLSLVTNSTDLKIDAVIQGLKLFDDFEFTDLKDYPAELNIKAEPFAFKDLAVFVPTLEILKGTVDLNLQAGGFWGNMLVDNLILDYGSSHFDINGYVDNLHTPSDLSLNLNFNNSKTSILDAAVLIPSLDLPEYNTLDISNFNLAFNGTPVDFKTVFDGEINGGQLNFDADLDFSTPLPKYSVLFNAKKLNISELVNDNSIINAKGTLKGKGVDPTKISAILEMDAYNSTYNGYSVDSLRLDLAATAKVFELQLDGLINNTSTDVAGKLDLTSRDNPIYDLRGTVENLDLARFTVDSNYVSLLNFNFTSDGQGLNLDEMTGEFNLEFDQSIFKTTFFEDASINLSLNKQDDFREIILVSDFMDFSISGNFSLQDAVELLAYQAEQTSKIISSKIEELNPMREISDSLNISTTSIIDTAITNNKFNFEYEFEFKDFELIALLIGEEELGIAGTGGGFVKNDSENFGISSDLTLDYFYTLNKDEILYLSNLEANLNFSRNNNSVSFDNLFGALSVSSDRIVAGSIVKNFTSDFVFNQSKLIYNVYTEIDTFLTSDINGQMKMRPGNQYLEIDSAKIVYKDVKWRNRDPIEIEFSPDSIKFNKFRFFNKDAYFDVNGLFTTLGNINMLIEAGKIPGDLLSYYTLGQPEAGFNAETNLATKIIGNIDDPKVSMDFRINDISINDRNLGNLYCLAGYDNKNFAVDFKFVDSTFNLTKPYFQLVGNVPVNLVPTPNEKIFDPAKLLDLTFNANDFNVAALGNVLPTISNQKGLLSGSIKVNGPFNDFNTEGKIRLNQFEFLSDLNNLQYKAGLVLDFKKNMIEFDSLVVSNLVGSKLQGKLSGSGYVRLEGFSPSEINLSFTGGLGVLGKRSKAVSKQVYGNLFIETQDKIQFTNKNNLNTLTGSVLLREVDITFTPLKSGYSASNNIIYDFKVDSSKIDREKLKFDKLIAYKFDKGNDKSNNRLANFNYTINVEIETQAKIDFILSPEFNQKLSVLASGKMRYESIDGQPVAQGEFNLLDGSKLEFFKVFEAEGSIRFETKVTDPYLDILATYNTEWYQENSTPTPVAVKIQITGNFSELGRNLSTNSENIRVYVGNNNINNNLPDLRYDAKNALSFILVNKPDFVGSDQGTGTLANDLLYGTSFSILGSALTSLVNSRIGDAINDIKLSRTEQETRFNVSGKIENIRYTVGVTSNETQKDLDPNLRIEYLFNPNFLIRLERKPPINATIGSTEKINELGLKYIFVF